MSAMNSSTLGAFRLASGRMRRRVDGASPTGLFHALPILGLGRELVAGDDGPLLHIDVLVGQQDVSGIEAELTEFFVHGVSS